MGQTISFLCHHCGYEERISMGVGMFWDLNQIFQGIVNDVKRGKYGELWKTELHNNPSLVVNISDELYVCPSCGYYCTGLNLSLYNQTDKIPMQFHHRKAYGTDLTLDLSSDYQLYKKYPHACKMCGEYLRIYNFQQDVPTPCCPKCGSNGEMKMDILWD